MNKYLKAVLAPIRSSYEVASLLSPEFYWNRVHTLGQRAGLSKAHLIISFDCDTDRDAEVVDHLDQKLRNMGLLPAYAVPGELLLKQKETYQRLRNRGASFLNHGYLIHTHWNESTKEYESCYFYDQISREDVTKDVNRGHEVLREFLKREPLGFRAPHFGTFQSKGELCFLHQELKKLGYLYSSSTAPISSALYGPLFDKYGILEIPVLGTASNPRTIYDSWGFFEAPRRRWKEGDYLSEALRLCERLDQMSFVGILNLYADPSQVWNRPEFFQAMEALSKSATSLNMDDIINLYPNETQFNHI